MALGEANPSTQAFEPVPWVLGDLDNPLKDPNDPAKIQLAIFEPVEVRVVESAAPIDHGKNGQTERFENAYAAIFRIYGDIYGIEPAEIIMLNDDYDEAHLTTTEITNFLDEYGRLTMPGDVTRFGRFTRDLRFNHKGHFMTVASFESNGKLDEATVALNAFRYTTPEELDYATTQMINGSNRHSERQIGKPEPHIEWRGQDPAPSL